MAKLDLFGTRHVDRPSKVRKELDEFADDADVLFSEDPRVVPDLSDKRALLLRNPAIYLTGKIVRWLWVGFGFVLTRQFKSVDEVATEKVAQDRGLEIEPVDLNLHRRSSDISLAVTVFSWFWFALAAVLFVFGLLVPSPVNLVASLVIGFLPVLPLIQWTLPERDETMAENIEEVLMSNEDLNKGCLVVGKGHTGVVKELEESDVEIGEIHKSKFFRRSL